MAMEGSSASVVVHNYHYPNNRQNITDTDRQQAAELLQQIPDKQIPDRAALPPFSRLDWQPNQQFVGRHSELQTLARHLKQGKNALINQAPVIAGLGGVGKTQLAVEMAYRYGGYFAGGVFWLSFAEAANIKTEIIRCGERMDLGPDYQDLPFEAQIRAVLQRWQDGLPRLLIFDNCEDPELFRQWRPNSGECRILLTSRLRDWPLDLGMQPLPLNSLPRAESIALLCRFRPDLSADDPSLHAIAEELGDLPLALHMAGHFLQKYCRIPAGAPAAYLEALKRDAVLNHCSLSHHSGQTPTGHDRHVGRTFQISVERLAVDDPTDQLARDALAHAAHLAPGEPIPFWLLAEILDLDPHKEDDQLRLNDALQRLCDLGLCALEGSDAILHRLVAAFARQGQGEQQRQRVEVVAKGVAYRHLQAGLPKLLQEWQGHLQHVAEQAERQESEIAGTLWNNLGYHLQNIADYSAARDALQRALRIGEATYGPDNPEVVTDVNNLGSLLLDMGELTAAREAFQRALRIGEASYRPDHPMVATLVNNLGNVHLALRDLPAARDAFQRALRIGEATRGPDHSMVATLVNNLGLVLQQMGELPAAHDALQRALRIDEATYEPDHPEVARGVNNLGSVLQEMGDLSAAHDAFQRALRIFEQTLPPDHPNITTVRNNLASLNRLFPPGKDA